MVDGAGGWVADWMSDRVVGWLKDGRAGSCLTVQNVQSWAIISGAAVFVVVQAHGGAKWTQQHCAACLTFQSLYDAGTSPRANASRSDLRAALRSAKVACGHTHSTIW